ncbi:hypothetical protein ACCS54_23060 [Rhizobium johnstonii]|uniref:hypothetical protein n=1 Tax=Rhizobium johnstonii TaxID=3019933 RepID=UPI003F9B076B
MSTMKENDVFALPREVNAVVIGEHTDIVLPAGTVVTVVVVFGDPDSPTAYEVEAFLPDSSNYALATVEATDIR